MSPYNLVHIVMGNEYSTPLVASQLFDRAQIEATEDGINKPASVSVWIIAPMREVYNKKSIQTINTLKQRCPNITIKIIGGIGRFRNWPINTILKLIRIKLKTNTVYHCRGESSFVWAYNLKKIFNRDAIVLDIRGFWPLERLNAENLHDEKYATDKQKKIYFDDLNRLKEAVSNSDYVCTVSESLKQMLIEEVYANKNTVVVPCCVKNIIPDTNRAEIRSLLKLENKIAILYLGGTQVYQHLDDLVIPFIKTAMRISDKYIGVFITQNRKEMTDLISKHQLDHEKIRIISVSQDKVADYLTGMDIGLLLRAPSRLINISQPVKFGEYLSAGIAVVLEDGMKSAKEILNRYKIGTIVKLSDKTRQIDLDNEVKKALQWYEDNEAEARKNAREYVTENYTWQANVPIERKMYIEALNIRASKI